MNRRGFLTAAVAGGACVVVAPHALGQEQAGKPTPFDATLNSFFYFADGPANDKFAYVFFLADHPQSKAVYLNSRANASSLQLRWVMAPNFKHGESYVKGMRAMAQATPSSLADCFEKLPKLVRYEQFGRAQQIIQPHNYWIDRLLTQAFNRQGITTRATPEFMWSDNEALQRTRETSFEMNGDIRSQILEHAQPKPLPDYRTDMSFASDFMYSDLDWRITRGSRHISSRTPRAYAKKELFARSLPHDLGFPVHKLVKEEGLPIKYWVKDNAGDVWFELHALDDPEYPGAYVRESDMYPV
jgi:hypothetical protein